MAGKWEAKCRGRRRAFHEPSTPGFADLAVRTLSGSLKGPKSAQRPVFMRLLSKQGDRLRFRAKRTLFAVRERNLPGNTRHWIMRDLSMWYLLGHKPDFTEEPVVSHVERGFKTWQAPYPHSIQARVQIKGLKASMSLISSPVLQSRPVKKAQSRGTNRSCPYLVRDRGSNAILAQDFSRKRARKVLSSRTFPPPPGKFQRSPRGPGQPGNTSLLGNRAGYTGKGNFGVGADQTYGTHHKDQDHQGTASTTAYSAIS